MQKHFKIGEHFTDLLEKMLSNRGAATLADRDEDIRKEHCQAEGGDCERGGLSYVSPSLSRIDASLQKRPRVPVNLISTLMADACCGLDSMAPSAVSMDLQCVLMATTV